MQQGRSAADSRTRSLSTRRASAAAKLVQPQDQPQHVTAVHDLAVSGDGALQHVGDEQRREVPTCHGRRVPRPVDAVAADGPGDLAPPVHHDQAAGLGGGCHAIAGRHAADDDPAARQDLERRAEADASRTGARQLACSDSREDRAVAARRDLDDRRAGALQVGLVVEVADQDAASVQPAGAVPDDENAVRVDIPVVRHRRGNGLDLMEVTEVGGWRTWPSWLGQTRWCRGEYQGRDWPRPLRLPLLTDDVRACVLPSRLAGAPKPAPMRGWPQPPGGTAICCRCRCSRNARCCRPVQKNLRRTPEQDRQEPCS